MRRDETRRAAIQKILIVLGRDATATEFVNSIFTWGFFFLVRILDVVFCIAGIVNWGFCYNFLLWHWLAPPFLSSRLFFGALNNGARYCWVVYYIIFRDFSGLAYEEHSKQWNTDCVIPYMYLHPARLVRLSVTVSVGTTAWETVILNVWHTTSTY